MASALKTVASRPTSADVLITQAERLADPITTLERLAAARVSIAATHARLQAATHAAIVGAREAGITWPEIGGVLGVSAQRAQQLARPE